MKIFKPGFWVLVPILLLNACNGTNKKTDNKTVGDTAVNTTIVNTKDSIALIPIDTTAATPLEGTWVCKREVGSSGNYLVGVIYEFKGTRFTVYLHGNANPGSALVSNKSFISQTIGDKGEKYNTSFEYRFKGDSLLINLKDDLDTDYFVKQK